MRWRRTARSTPPRRSTADQRDWLPRRHPRPRLPTSSIDEHIGLESEGKSIGVRATSAALPAVCAAIIVVVLAPTFRPGFVLAYDRVLAPLAPLLPESLGLGAPLPPSVPADAVVAFLTAVLPGDLVQKLILGLTVFAAGLGAGRLVPTEATATRVIAADAYAWNAYVAERLFIGHWAL